MSRVIFLKADKAKRDSWAGQWIKEGSDRVLADFDKLIEAINPTFRYEVDSIVVAVVINIVRNAVQLDRHVLVNIDTKSRARFQRIETIARQCGGDVQWLEI